MRELQASGARAHEDDARVLRPREQRDKVLDAGGRAGRIGGHGQGADFAEGTARVGLVA